MVKTVETVHCRIETFVLNQQEIRAALRLKYGAEIAFDNATMSAARLEMLLPTVPGYGDLSVEFTVDLDRCCPPSGRS